MPTRYELPRTAPEQQGIPSSAILRFVEALDRQIHEMHSFMLVRHGSVVAEGWWSPYSAAHPHQLFSVSKSFTATAVGLAVAEGYFAIDDPVLTFFPDETPAEVNDQLAAMRVRHLLTMSSGQAMDTWELMVDRPDGNWIKGFFTAPVVDAPGTHFVYNTGATYILSAIVQKTTGLKVVDYLQAGLFEPLGISRAAWSDSPQGITAGGIGLSLTTEDVARFGQLYLQHGMWQGQQLLPEAWIAEATRTQIGNDRGGQPDWSQGYGYQFWRCRHNAYRADGVFGQFCIVLPEQDAVLAMTGGIDIFDAQEPLDLVWELLLPAMGTASLDEDSVAHRRLGETLADLQLPPVQGTVDSPLATRVSGRTYTVASNDLHIQTIALNFTDSGCVVHLETPAGTETITCGWGEWRQGQYTALFRQPVLFDRTIAAASGAWTGDDCFTMIVRLYETPFYHTLVYHFIGDELLVEISINVSLQTLEPLLLTAYVS
ncbi:MAG: serine hydrolase [Anaerolineae bacterium]|nr:serine hydrolase [Anaerolineae bacterium]